MTGFGRGTSATSVGNATVEVSSVNRKQVEVVLSAPRELASLETAIRQLVLPHVSRGRVQVVVSFAQAGGSVAPLRIDDALAKGLDEELRRISALLGRDLVPQVGDFFSVPGLLIKADTTANSDDAWTVIEKALHTALADFVISRSTEGAALDEDLRARLAKIEQEWHFVSEKAPGRTARHAEMLQKRLAELGCAMDLSDERLLKEIALFADRCDVSEEITRLQSHFAAFRNYLEAQESPGRALDFLCQELHREWNTIGSKAADSDIAQAVVRAKTELEKIREQVQNVE
jgi:uncharacterized protein (TIGR00255 family)